ncbi:hypothetical protein SAMN05660297_02906 [Natronincola peptidivorans]|uniref:Uncharacterized protein n=1 Tax=Natronincola peptidivorans TaxID=426128 RepID=A0A1I0FR33_9FIRM|nr:hypothetical protein [Natronincola peptidivorans]SET60851.1 hypothetical protein SAMN05660297_02906 [Natronincola peptidivorans]
MKKLFLLIFITTLFLTGCSQINNRTYTYIDVPEEINLYYRGDIVNIQKNTEKYDIILSFINKTIADTEPMGIMKSVRIIPDEEKIKTTGYALELIYEKTTHNQLMIDGRKQVVRFDKVLIPLDNNIIFIGGEEGYSSKALTISFIPKEFVATLLDYKNM